MQQYTVKCKMQNWRLEQTGLPKPNRTHGLTGMGPGLAYQVAVGQLFGQVLNWTDLFWDSKPGPLAGNPDPLLTLLQLKTTPEYNACEYLIGQFCSFQMNHRDSYIYKCSMA